MSTTLRCPRSCFFSFLTFVNFCGYPFPLSTVIHIFFPLFFISIFLCKETELLDNNFDGNHTGWIVYDLAGMVEAKIPHFQHKMEENQQFEANLKLYCYF